MLDYEEFKWIPLELTKNPGHWSMCADFMEDLGRHEDAECLRLADSLAVPMVWCPPGRFMMGDLTRLDSAQSDNCPVSVSLSYGFWIGSRTITWEEWYRNTITVRKEIDMSDYARQDGDDVRHLPVNTVSWNDARAFINDLNTGERRAGRLPTGWEYSLPTEAQWEYACRAGTTTRFHFGDNCDDFTDYGWSSENSGGRVHPVCRKRSNAWGIYDMHGNVTEWCSNRWGKYPLGGVDPTGCTEVAPHHYTGDWRAARGGDYCYSAVHCPTHTRGGLARNMQGIWSGFRIVLIPSSKCPY